MRSINRSLIIECLQELSDRSIQERLWMSSGPSEVSSFTEAVEQLFTDSGLRDAIDSGTTELSHEAESMFRELHAQLSNINARAGPKAILADPAMLRVRELAAAALALITN